MKKSRDALLDNHIVQDVFDDVEILEDVKGGCQVEE